MLGSIKNEFEIVEKSIYKKTSLKQDILSALRKNDKLNDEEIINIVVKYFISYIFPDKIEEELTYEQICKFIRIISCNYITTLYDEYENQTEIYKFIKNNRYAVSMLGDIAATVELFKEIANKEISPIKFNYEYLGLDLGTGSGILLLAQYIQAEKNNFGSISNFGLEISNSCFRTKSLVNKLMFGRVINCDTTKEESYNFLKYSETEITHISNETIPTVGISFGHYLMNKTPHNPDPFIENNMALFGSCSDKITEATIFFPEKVRIILTNNPREVESSKNIIIGNRENKFGIDIINEKESEIRTNLKNLGFNISPYIFPTGIEMGGEIVRQDNIGNRLIQSGMVKRLPEWKYRWNY